LFVPTSWSKLNAARDINDLFAGSPIALSADLRAMAASVLDRGHWISGDEGVPWAGPSNLRTSGTTQNRNPANKPEPSAEHQRFSLNCLVLILQPFLLSIHGCLLPAHPCPESIPETSSYNGLKWSEGNRLQSIAAVP